MSTVDVQTHNEEQAGRDARAIRRLKGFSAFLLLVLAAASFTAGVPGLLDAGRWARLGEMAWLTPIAIDGGLVFFSASAMAWRAETARASALAWTMVVLLTIVSVASQVTHVLSNAATPGVQEFVGAGVASMFPLLVLASTRQFEMLRFSRLIDREAARVTRQTATAAQRRRPTQRVAPQPKTPAPATRLAPEVVAGGQQGSVEAYVAELVRSGRRPNANDVATRMGKSKATALRLINRVIDEHASTAEEPAPRLSLVDVSAGR